MRYFKSRKGAEYEDLLQGSKFAYQVSRPPNINNTDITREAFVILKHPLINDYVACVSDDIYVHPGVKQAAQGTGNFPAQEVFINNVEDAARIKDLIKNNVRVQVADILPSRWTEKTKEQLTVEGFF